MENEAELASYLEKQLNVSLNDFSELQILKEARRELKENLKLAKQLKAFGVPSFVVEGELFWGHDALTDFDQWLEGKDDLDKDEYNRFLKLF
jgi:2-hydroxychromene-2-carboxylate isomerase